MAESMGDANAALMDQVYRYRRYTYNLTRKYLFGCDWTIREIELKPDEHMIEADCGIAYNPICVVLHYPDPASMAWTLPGKYSRPGPGIWTGMGSPAELR